MDDDCRGIPPYTDCGEYVICNDDHQCECACHPPGEDCSRDPSTCYSGCLVCDVFTNMCVEPCTSDEECQARTEIPFHDDLKCDNGVCDFEHCTTDADCPGGRVCFNGNCVTIPECIQVKECFVLPGNAITRQGTSAQLSATAYLHGGSVAPGITFSWSSSNPAVVSVDDAGLVTGGANTGGATITAAATPCPNVTCTASVTNYGPSMNTRVTVVDELELTPVQGASVILGTMPPVVTDANGVASFSTLIDPNNPENISVFKRDYHYHTLNSVEKNDIIVHLGKIHHLDFSTDPPTWVAGGARGKMHFDRIRCEEPQKTCDVSYGFGGLSVPGNFFNMDLTGFFNCTVYTDIELGGNNERIPLPCGTVLCMNQTCFKDYYAAVGVPGKRVVWGLGGKLDLADLIDKLGPVITGGDDIDFGIMMVGLTQLFSHFYTDMVPNFEVVPIPMVDGEGTIECDPGTQQVPDFFAFPVQDLTLGIVMDRTMTFDTPALPVGTYDSVALIGGVIVRGAGFVPLGLAAGTDLTSEDDTPDGVIENPIELRVAEVAGRVPEGQFRRVVVALALKLSGIADETALKYNAVQVLFLDSFSGHHVLDPFMLPAELTYDPVTRRLTVTNLPSGADFYQATFADECRCNWNILGEWAPGDYTLPPPPTDEDRADTAIFVSVDLVDGLDYQTLLEFNDTNLGDLVELVQAFSITEIP